MARKRLLYWLFSKRKKPYYVHTNGIILEGDVHLKKIDGEPAHLDFDPEGWKDTTVKFVRNQKYWAIFRDMALPMKFIRDGHKILKDLFVQKGIEAICYLGISKLDPVALPYQYDSWYLSEVNFLKTKLTQGVIQVEALEGGLQKYIKANENTVYDFPVSPNSDVSVLMDGMELANTATWFVSNGLGQISGDPLPEYGSHVIATDLIQKEIEDIGGVFSCVRTKVDNNNTSIRNTGQYLFKATAPGSLKVDYNFKVDVRFDSSLGVGQTPGNTMAIVLRVINESNVATSNQVIATASTIQLGAGISLLVQGTKTVTLSEGDELYFYALTTVQGTGGDDETIWSYYGGEPTLKMSYTYRHPESVVLGFTPLKLLTLIMDKITGGDYNGIKSNFLTGLNDSIAITSGQAIRGLPDAKLSTSLSSFFKSFNRYGIMLGVDSDDYLVVEKFETSLDNNTIIYDCGEVDDAELSVAEDLIFNTIKVGYKEQEYKEINGLSEFNQGQVWGSTITKLTKELDLQSEYRADPFGIELLRINFGQKTTTDTKSDNETFFLNIKPQFTAITGKIYFSNPVSFNLMLLYGQAGLASKFKYGTKFKISGTQFNNNIFTSGGNAGSNNGVDLIVGVIPASIGGIDLITETAMTATLQFQTYILNRPAYSSVSGLIHPGSAFNIELSPKRSLLENGNYIRSVLDKNENDFLKLVSSDKNTDLITDLGGVIISEKADVQPSVIGTKLFRPYYITFTTESPVNLLSILKPNPYGKIKFSIKGEIFFGFIMDISLKPGDNDTQKWKLLSAPENDFRKFYKE